MFGGGGDYPKAQNRANTLIYFGLLGTGRPMVGIQTLGLRFLLSVGGEFSALMREGLRKLVTV